MSRIRKQLILLLGDIVILYLSLFLGLTLRHLKAVPLIIFKEHLLPFSIIYAVWLIIFFINDLYDLKVTKNIKKLILRLSNILIANIIIAVALLYFINSFEVSPKTNLLIIVLISSILIVIWRIVYNQLINFQTSKINILLVGFPKEEKIIKQISDHNSFGYKVKKSIYNINPHTTRQIIKEENIDMIVVKNDYYEKAAPHLYQFISQGINIYNFSTFWEDFQKYVPVTTANEAWFLENLRQQRRIYTDTKRLLDICVSIILCLILMLIFPFVFLGIKITSRGPVFYKQNRVGKNNKIIEIIKFRTMFMNSEQNGAQWAKKNDNRVTKFGKFLRKTRIDEIPQALNILKGEMSLVGPRPERPEFIKILIQKVPHYELRHIVKPGLTGWAQIKYPYGSSVEDAKQKLCYDLYYIKNRSFLLDLNIILKTAATVFNGKGV